MKHRVHNLSVEVQKRPWQTFCTSEQPTLDAEWPPEVTFDLSIILAAKDIVFQGGQGEHLDQQEDLLLLDPPPPYPQSLALQPAVMEGQVGVELSSPPGPGDAEPLIPRPAQGTHIRQGATPKVLWALPL